MAILDPSGKPISIMPSHESRYGLAVERIQNMSHTMLVPAKGTVLAGFVGSEEKKCEYIRALHITIGNLYAEIQVLQAEQMALANIIMNAAQIQPADYNNYVCDYLEKKAKSMGDKLEEVNEIARKAREAKAKESQTPPNSGGNPTSN